MTRLYLILGALVFAAISLAIVAARPLAPYASGRTEVFEVRASETSGSVLLEWSPESRLVRSATGGLLEFLDGATAHREQVNPRVLRQGGLEYRRRSQDVLLRLSLLKDNGVIGHASVRLTGAPVPAAAPGR